MYVSTKEQVPVSNGLVPANIDVFLDKEPMMLSWSVNAVFTDEDKKTEIHLAFYPVEAEELAKALLTALEGEALACQD